VASVYGMSFEHMPELRWHFGCPWVIGHQRSCVRLVVPLPRAQGDSG
jgi:Mg2+ and Co2+ transporter CorA